ncbi:YadA-like family protein, partial [Salmonella enterica]|nr:YadA-like family protein [Salmonella enterica]
PLKSTRFTLSSIVMALFLTSNIAYAANVQVGDGAQAKLARSTAIGEGAVADNIGSTAIGREAKANGFQSTATGGQAQAVGTQSTAIGTSAQAGGLFSTALGGRAKATAVNSTAIGTGAEAGGENSMALGTSSYASKKNEVNIGSWTIDPNTLIKSQIETRTLSGLSDGKNDDEAVNLKQLQQVASDARIYTNEQLQKIPKISGISKVDAEGIADAAKGKAIDAAKVNTTDEIGKLNLDTKLATADQNAKGYASNAVTEADGHTDGKIKALDLDTKLGTADQNAQGYASDVLKSANDNIERRAVSAENNAVTRSKAYTDERSDRTLESANIYTNHRAAQAENNAVARSNNYTDNRFSELRKNLEHTEKRLNAGIAGVTALSSIPYAAGNNFSYGIGAGNYQNGNAVAAGVQLRVSQSTNVRLNISWDSAGNNATGVGIAGGW